MPAFVAQNPDFDAAVRESFGRISLMRTIGARLATVAPGEVQVVLPFREELAQHHGFLAAAVLTAIADVACGYAAMSLMPAGASVLTVEYKVNFVAPAQSERVVARARVVRPGRTVTTCSADVFAMTGAEEKLVATMLATMIQAGGERAPSPEHRGANSAWQQRSVLAHNLARSFQLDTLATPKPPSRKRTYAYLIRSMRTLRFLLIVRAGRLTRLGGRHVLRLAHNPATETLYASIDHRLAA